MDGRRKIGVMMLLVNFLNQSRQSHMARAGNVLQRFPKTIFHAHARLAAGRAD
jgi:hypothetical protein